MHLEVPVHEMLKYVLQVCDRSKARALIKLPSYNVLRYNIYSEFAIANTNKRLKFLFLFIRRIDKIHTRPLIDTIALARHIDVS